MLLFMQIDNREPKIKFFQTLNEHQQRQYAVIEAHTLGHGGQRAVSQSFDIHADTIRRGMSGLATDKQPPPGRIRKSGGGRKKIAIAPHPVRTFQQIAEDYTAGMPDNEHERWVGLHPGQICDKMSRAGIRISRYIASELPEFCGFRKRRYAKTLCLGRHDDREAQFQKIARFHDASVAEGLPILSTDTKKKG